MSFVIQSPPIHIRQSFLRNSSSLANYIERLSTPASENKVSHIRLVVKKALQSTSLVIIGGARYGMISVCVTGARIILEEPNNAPLTLTLGGISGASVVLTMGAMSAFTMLRIIDEITHVNSKEELDLILNVDISKWKKTALTVTSIGTGLIAQIPLAYVTYKASFSLPWLWAGFQLFDCGRVSYSINESLKELIKRKEIKKNSTVTLFEKQLDQSRSILIQSIANFRRALADENTDHVKLFEQFANQIKNYDLGEISTDERSALLSANGINHQNYVSTILDKNIPQIAAPIPTNKIGSRAIDVIAFIMAAVVLAKFWKLAADAADMATEGEPTAIRDFLHYLSGVLVLAANLYLWIKLVNSTTHLMVNFARGQTPKAITSKLHGRAHKMIAGTGIVASLFLFVPQFYFTKLSFPGWPYYPVGVISTAGTAFAGIGSTLSLRDILLKKFTRNPTSKKVLELDQNLQKLMTILPKIKQKEFVLYLLSVNDSIRQNLQSPSVESLTQYLEEHP